MVAKKESLPEESPIITGASYNPLIIKVKYHSADLPKLKKIEQGDWIDLYTAEDAHLEMFQYKQISLGVSIQLPKGYEANIVMRSSTFKKWGVLQANSFGVIDESYCGPLDVWQVPVVSLKNPVFIPKGTSICQFRIHEKMGHVTIEEVDTLSGKSRGGFGSTSK